MQRIKFVLLSFFIAISFITTIFITTAMTSTPLLAAQSPLNKGLLSCLLEPSSEVQLSSAVSGVVQEMHVQRGDLVEVGQILLSLNSTVESAALNTALAKVEFAQRKVRRNAKLYKKKLISDHEQDEMLTERRLANFLAIEAKVRLQQRQTLSPVKGVVVERLKEPGEFVDDTPFLKIVTLDPLHAQVVFNAHLYGEINRGMSVKIYPEGREHGFAGKIIIVDPIIDAASNSFGATVLLNNDHAELFAGVRCNIEFLLDQDVEPLNLPK